MRSLFLRVFLWFGIAMVLVNAHRLPQASLRSVAFNHLATIPWRQ